MAQLISFLLNIGLLLLVHWMGVEAGKHAYRVAIAIALAERERDAETEAEGGRFLARVEQIVRERRRA